MRPRGVPYLSKHHDNGTSKHEGHVGRQGLGLIAKVVDLGGGAEVKVEAKLARLKANTIGNGHTLKQNKPKPNRCIPPPSLQGEPHSFDTSDNNSNGSNQTHGRAEFAHDQSKHEDDHKDEDESQVPGD